ncbi:MAG: class I SAM-dependent methyltransferase [Crocosphaera sp.]
MQKTRTEMKKSILVGSHPCFEGCNVYISPEDELGFTEPLPSQKQILDFYKSGFYIKDDQLTGLESRLKFVQKRASAQYNFIASFLSKAKVLDVLDIGCSEGSLLLLFSELGYNVTGYEPDVKMAVFARERLKTKLATSQIINGMFGSEQNEQFKYDLICSSHLFEHIADPVSHLNILRKSLKNDGILFMEVPNQYTLGVRNCITPSIFSQANSQGHLYFYSPKSIESILNKNGFEVLSLRTCGKNVKNVFAKQSAINLQKNPLFNLITGFMSKLEKKLENKNFPVRTNKNKNLTPPFETYWEGKQSGQWIRLIAKPY